jgi:hypothetical protein
MAKFAARVYQNEFLPPGGTEVTAIVTGECMEANPIDPADEAGEILILDLAATCLSGYVEHLEAIVAAVLANLPDRSWFALIAGSHKGIVVFPPAPAPAGLVQVNARTRRAAVLAVSRYRPYGRRELGSWLTVAARLFAAQPGLTRRHVLLVTTGENEEPPHQLQTATRDVVGRFQCDCRGVGVDWQVAEVRQIAEALLGTVDIIPSPLTIAETLGELVQQSVRRTVPNVRLVVWVPLGVELLFIRQVAPTVEDLTGWAQPYGPVSIYPTGAWSEESRDFHLSLKIPPGELGQERLAARVQFIGAADEVFAEALVRATWSAEEALTLRLNAEVAHYTGQTKLADAIMAQLPPIEPDTTKLGRPPLPD